MDPSYTEAGAHASQPQSHSIAPSASSDRLRRLKSIFSGSAGNLIEWYDWYVYSAFAL
jgi:MHS family alpha-ketoglutarate permease-like MFS transporter